MPDKVLKELDIVVASIHSGFKNPKEKITKRMLKAMENENVDIIAHPTGRLITKRERVLLPGLLKRKSMLLLLRTL